MDTRYIGKDVKNINKNFDGHNREKRPLLWSFIIIALVAALWHFCRGINFNSEPTTALVTEPVVPPPTHAPVRYFVNHIVKPGDTFGNILSNRGMADKDIFSCYNHMRSLGLTAIYPGDSLVFKLKQDSSVEKVSLLSRLQTWYHASIEELQIKTEKKPVATSTHLCVARGKLLTSLSEAMYEIGIGDALTAKLTDIFAWDINFFIDPKKGDTFEVIFEKKYAEGRFVSYGEIYAAKYVNQDREFYALAMKNNNGTFSHFDRDGKSVQKQFLKAPLRFRRISSGYSYRRKHPVLGIVRPHLGIDYAAPRGTPVHSAADGVVSFVGTKGGYGKHIRIRHGASYETYYGHLNAYAKGIRRGARVSQGQFIGTVGSTGLSTGPHLDYRMKVGSRFVNPQTITAPPKEGVSDENRLQFELLKHKYLSLLELRCPESNNCYVISIDSNDGSSEHKVRIIARESTLNGNKSDS